MSLLRFTILCSAFISFALHSAVAQPLDSLETIDMENLRNQEYLSIAPGIDCDSTTGTMIEERICANLKLQRQDSLLQRQIASVVKELKEDGRESALESFLLGQKLWERYRFAHCSSLIFEEDMSAIDMILFMQCAADLTEDRLREIDSQFGE